MTKAEYEQRFRELLGITRVLWLDHGYLEGDDTDGHIDTLARFAGADTIAYTTCENPDEPHYDALQSMQEELLQFTTLAGAPYRLVPLPLPSPIHDEDGRQLPATYANFLIINEAVLVPTYDDPRDSLILERLQECFPDRHIVGIDCREIVFQYGSLHCLTMQYPAGVVAPR
jgi:agmatine/peptidylarginine deiminase